MVDSLFKPRSTWFQWQRSFQLLSHCLLLLCHSTYQMLRKHKGRTHYSERWRQKCQGRLHINWALNEKKLANHTRVGRASSKAEWAGSAGKTEHQLQGTSEAQVSRKGNRRSEGEWVKVGTFILKRNHLSISNMGLSRVGLYRKCMATVWRMNLRKRRRVIAGRPSESLVSDWK